jgi:serine phosphatase RsbU (regulator of sigma subunit)/pSer/pThr/pTyr-binding forkhead associated (FHA) protein
MPFLTSDSANEEEQRFELNAGDTVMGRHPECQVVLQDAAVSRQHAKITSRNGKYLLEDLKSRNGTYLNRRMIQQPTRLLDGDRIRICDHVFVFHLDDPGVLPQRETIDSGSTSVQSSVLLDENAGRGLSSILSQMDLSSHRSSTQVTSADPQAKLVALMNISKALGAALDLETVLPRVLDSLFELFPQADRGFIVLATPEGNLKPLAMKLRRETDESTFRISRTIVRHVMDTRKAVISTDAANDERFDLSQSIADFRIRSMMCAPLLDSEGRSTGIIQIDSLQSHSGFTDEDLDILATVALQAGAAIDRAKLHDVALKQQQLRRDLELANEIQHRLLPADPPRLEGYALYDFYRPAEQVGGDYFDYIELPDGRTAVLVGDVVGHGIAAALLMAKVSAEARFALASERTAAAAINRLNHAICRLGLDRFVTVVLVLLDPSLPEISIVNAGHLPPVLRRRGADAESLESEYSGLPVGVDCDYCYEQFSVNMSPGDLLVVYTDGVSEAAGPGGELFGNRRVIAHLNEQDWEDGTQFGKSLVQVVRQYMSGSRQEDDICLVCISRT